MIGAYKIVFCILLWTFCLFDAAVSYDDEELINDEPHPDPNEEDYPNMIYIGRIDDDGKRLGSEYDNGMCLYLRLYKYLLQIIFTLKSFQHAYLHIIRHKIYLRYWIR